MNTHTESALLLDFSQEATKYSLEKALSLQSYEQGRDRIRVGLNFTYTTTLFVLAGRLTHMCALFDLPIRHVLFYFVHVLLQGRDNPSSTQGGSAKRTRLN